MFPKKEGGSQHRGEVYLEEELGKKTLVKKERTREKKGDDFQLFKG